MFTAKTQKSCYALHWSMMHVCTRCVVVQTSWTIFKFIGLCLSPLCRFVAAQWVSVLSYCLIWHVSHLTALINLYNPSGIILYTNYACNGKRKSVLSHSLYVGEVWCSVQNLWFILLCFSCSTRYASTIASNALHKQCNDAIRFDMTWYDAILTDW